MKLARLCLWGMWGFKYTAQPQKNKSRFCLASLQCHISVCQSFHLLLLALLLRFSYFLLAISPEVFGRHAAREIFMLSEGNIHFIESNTEARRNLGQKVHPQLLECSNFLQHLGTSGATCLLVPLRVCRSTWLVSEQWLLSNFEMKANYFDVWIKLNSGI